MVVSSKYIRDILHKVWPNLDHIWLRNTQYVLPTPEDLRVIVKQHISSLPVIHGFNECENFALFLHADVKRHRVLEDPEEKFNWAFGDFICKKKTTLQGVMVHSACICITTDGVYIIEPMNKNAMEYADNKKYAIFFINLN